MRAHEHASRPPAWGAGRASPGAAPAQGAAPCGGMATCAATWQKAQDAHHAQTLSPARHKTRRAGGGMAGVPHLVGWAASKTVPINSLLPDIAYALRLYVFVFASSLFLFLNQARPLFFLFPNKPCQKILSGWPEQERYVQSASARCLNCP